MTSASGCPWRCSRRARRGRPPPRGRTGRAVGVDVVEEAAVAHVRAVRPGHRGETRVGDSARATGGRPLGVDQGEHLALDAGSAGGPAAAAGRAPHRRWGRCRARRRRRPRGSASAASAGPHGRLGEGPRRRGAAAGRRRSAGVGRRGVAGGTPWCPRGRAGVTRRPARSTTTGRPSRPITTGESPTGRRGGRERGRVHRRATVAPGAGGTGMASTSATTVLTSARAPAAEPAAKCVERGRRRTRPAGQRTGMRASGGTRGTVVHGGTSRGDRDHDSLPTETNGARKVTVSSEREGHSGPPPAPVEGGPSARGGSRAPAGPGTMERVRPTRQPRGARRR